MKTTNRFFLAMTIMFLLFSTTSFSQDEPKRPKYLTVTTMHWNMDNDDFEMDEWKALEKEYLDKVVRKNEFVVSASYYMHQFTADNTELLYVQTYASWEAIDKVGKRNAELEKEAWPDEDARKALAKKRDAYYDLRHSDEIYATLPYAKLMAEAPTKDMTLYVRKSHFANYEDGSDEEFDNILQMGRDKIIGNNEFIKGYYPSVHAWGADKTEYIEAFIVESVGELDKMFDKTQELIKELTDEEKAVGKNRGKYFTGVHGDYIYTYVHM